MQPEESIADVQKRFSHIVNHLTGLGKEFDREELNIKILKCLDRSWQPMVTAISESRDLSKLGTDAPFGKLMEHELELKRLIKQETVERKPKGLALKARHIKTDCPDNQAKDKSASKRVERSKGRRAYISWEENEVSSTSSSSTEDEENNLCFMMKDEESISDSVSDFSVDSDNYDQLLASFKETHDEANRLAVQIISSFNLKDIVSTKKPLDVLHVDLFGPSRVASLAGNLLLIVEESMHVVFDETDHSISKTAADDLDSNDFKSVLNQNESIHFDTADAHTMQESTAATGLPKEWKTPRDLTLDNVIGNIEEGVSTRKSLNNFCEAMAFVSHVEPKNLNEALKDRNWILAMQEELNQFALNEVFYTNLTLDGKNVVSYVKGIKMKITSEVWNSMAEIKYVGLKVGKGNTSGIQEFNKLQYYKSCMRNPTESISRFHAGHLNLTPRLVAYIIAWLVDYRFPYAILVSKLIDYFGVDVTNERNDPIKAVSEIDNSTLTKMGFHKIEDKWVVLKGNDPQAEHEASNLHNEA
ncbi:uncharacterized protein [Phaseolus vulgaris]|uniref:uncharacterized protein n=1 Tax=Phaseolus vulgaris TaxID=3885 RepID=UPI0035C9B936